MPLHLSWSTVPLPHGTRSLGRRAVCGTVIGWDIVSEACWSSLSCSASSKEGVHWGCIHLATLVGLWLIDEPIAVAQDIFKRTRQIARLEAGLVAGSGRCWHRVTKVIPIV